MQVDVCIQTRRSVRKYSDQDISGDTLREIVDLARFSPSWKNTQVVRYHVVKNADLKEKIAQNCVLGFDFNGQDDRALQRAGDRLCGDEGQRL